MSIDKIYYELVRKIYEEGYTYEDPNRKGVMRKEITDYEIKWDLRKGFPIIGLKQTYPKMAFNEMKAFMSGITNLRDLEALGVTFWRDDAFNYFKRKFPDSDVTLEEYVEGAKKGVCYTGPHFEWGDLGKIYSHHLRNWNGEFDQLDYILQRLKDAPNATKNVVTMWNPSDNSDCALSPCHWSFEFITKPLSLYEREEHFSMTSPKDDFDWYYNNVKESEKEEYFNEIGVPTHGLTVQWAQGSVDTFLGLPINIMYYSFVCYVFSVYLGMVPMGIVGKLSNVHLYDNSFKEVEELLSRDPESLKEPVLLNFTAPEEWSTLDDYLSKLDYKKSVDIYGYNHLGRLDVKMLAYS